MLVYSFAEIHRPFEEAEPILEKLLDGLSEAADIAYRRGEELLAEVGPGPRLLARTVRLHGGPARCSGGETIIPLTWEATGASGLFPRMEADIVLARMGPRHSHLSFRGSYEPPLGAAGLALDRILHRVAEATVKALTDRLAAALEAWPATEVRVVAPG
jgi:hypothetical protein